MNSKRCSASLMFKLVHEGRRTVSEPNDLFVKTTQPFSFSRAPNELVVCIIIYIDKKTMLV